MAVVVSASKVLLVLSKTVTSVLGDKALGVNQPELVTSGSLAQATASVVLDELLGDTDTGGTGTHEDQALLLNGDTRQVNGANVSEYPISYAQLQQEMLSLPSKDDSTSTLDVIVEGTVSVAVSVQVVESLLTLEVLELDNHVRVHLLDSSHELIHELLLDGNRGALLAQTQVEGVLQVSLVVGATVENDGQALGRVDTSGGSVQGQLANLNNTVSNDSGKGSDAGPVGSGPPRGMNLQRYQHR